MGRRPRQSGHRQGQYPLRRVVPNHSWSPPALPQHPIFETPSTSPIQPHEQSWLAPEAYVASQTEHRPEPVSPVSARSTLSHSSGSNSARTTSYTSAIAYARHLSPDANTPTSSGILNQQNVWNGRQVQDSHGWSRNGQIGASSSASDTDVQMTGITEAVLGIDVRSLASYSPDYLQRPQFVPERSSSPSNHRRQRPTTEPWSTLPLPLADGRHDGNTDTHAADAMDIFSEVTRSPTGRERPRGRTRPLSPEERKHAMNVRKEGACLRCTIMKEKCDTMFPCKTCLTKERRKIPKQCIRARFDWKECKSIMFPDELTRKLENKNVSRYLGNSVFMYPPREPFEIVLDMDIGDNSEYSDYIKVRVREFDPLDHPELHHAHVAAADYDGSKPYKECAVWNPPIIMDVIEGSWQKEIWKLQRGISLRFDKVLGNPHSWTAWTIKYFTDPQEDFQTTILEMIGHYYLKDIPEHGIIKTALSLLWFENLLLKKFTIPPEAVPELEEHLESQRPPGIPNDAFVIPATINRFLKAIIVQMAIDAARQVTEVLHDMLFKMAVSQKLPTGQTDIALCVAFVILMFVGRVQWTLVVLADSRPAESSTEYRLQDAEARIRAVEESICDYLVAFHKYTLSRKSPSKTAEAPAKGYKNNGAGSDMNNTACESHAKHFDLVGKLRREVEQDYASERPQNLELGRIDLRTFPYTNVGRLCWKLFRNIESDTACD
ncbi:hypothetical protein ABEF95_012796 [Exophiala dermatitidis]